jgi:hypothetical protein
VRQSQVGLFGSGGDVDQGQIDLLKVIRDMFSINKDTVGVECLLTCSDPACTVQRSIGAPEVSIPFFAIYRYRYYVVVNARPRDLLSPLSPGALIHLHSISLCTSTGKDSQFYVAYPGSSTSPERAGLGSLRRLTDACSLCGSKALPLYRVSSSDMFCTYRASACGFRALLAPPDDERSEKERKGHRR